jgi:protein-tyrosine-phosphatase
LDETIQKTVLPLVGRKQVLFISATGACRAPMAAAMAQERFGEAIRAGFAALRPAPEFSAPMEQFMRRIGIDMGYRPPQTIEQALCGTTPDLAVAIGEGVEKLPLPGVKTVHWSLPKPAAADDDAMERLRLAIEANVDMLMQSLK